VTRRDRRPVLIPVPPEVIDLGEHVRGMLRLDPRLRREVAEHSAARCLPRCLRGLDCRACGRCL
jgi:hypothetical protein